MPRPMLSYPILCLSLSMAMMSSSCLAASPTSSPSNENDYQLISEQLVKLWGDDAKNYVLIDASPLVQRLWVINEQHKPIAAFPISSGSKGNGQAKGSEKTPLGAFKIHELIGEGLPLNQVFENGVPVPKPTRPDVMMTRLVALDGLEQGYNHGGDVDALARGIFIHATNETTKIGKPASHGCIRMTPTNMLTLFGLLYPNMLVIIVDSSQPIP